MLGRPAQSVVALDPLNGNSAWPNPSNQRFRTAEVRLQLAAGESVILRVFADKKVEGPAWNYWQTNGQPAEITGPWNVKFIHDGPVLPADFHTTNLVSWTNFPERTRQALPAQQNTKSLLMHLGGTSYTSPKMKNPCQGLAALALRKLLS